MRAAHSAGGRFSVVLSGRTILRSIDSGRIFGDWKTIPARRRSPSTDVFGAYAWFDPLCNAVIVLTTAYSGIEYFIKNADVFREPD